MKIKKNIIEKHGINKNEYKFNDKIFAPKNRCPSNFINCPCQN